MGNKSNGSKMWIVYLLLIVGIVVFIAWVAMQPKADKPGERISDLGNQHIQNVGSPHKEYNTKPPTSGPHVGRIASWGVHSEQIEDEIQIHNLEDGGVIVHYDPEQVNDDTISELKKIVEEYDEGVILEPYADMDAVIVLTAWARIDRLDELDEQRILDFIKAYQGKDHHKR